MTTKAIAIHELRRQFVSGVRVAKKKQALDGLSLEVEEGEVFGFLGPNGAGKSTTIKILVSLLRQDSGEALIFGNDPRKCQSRRTLGFLPESPSFYDNLTGLEFVSFCGKLSGLSGKDLRRRAEEMLERVGLTSAMDVLIRGYSKGMNQRLGIAQALIHNPRLIVLDEPMSGLDPIGRGEIRRIIRQLKAEGITIFFSTHIIPDVETICDRVGVVSQGRLVRVGTVQELLDLDSSKAIDVTVEGGTCAIDLEGVVRVETYAGRARYLARGGDALQELIQVLPRIGGKLISVVPQRRSLEDLVVELLSKEGA